MVGLQPLQSLGEGAGPEAWGWSLSDVSPLSSQRGHTSPRGGAARASEAPRMRPQASFASPPSSSQGSSSFCGDHTQPRAPWPLSAADVRTQRGSGRLTDEQEEAGGLLWGAAWDLLVLFPAGISIYIIAT